MNRSARRSPRHILLPSSRAISSDAVDEGSVLFIGTATTLIRYRGITILTDPNFLGQGERVALGYGFHSTRLTEPAVPLDELPNVDLVLVSHMHEDHFDRVASEKLDRGVPMIATPQASAALSRLGFRSTHALATWQSIEVVKGSARLTVSATPAQHGPTLVASILPETMGTMLDFATQDGGRFRIWVSGDTIVHDRLLEIPKRFPAVDLALLHLGGARFFGALTTMDGEEGARAVEIVKPRAVVPVHYDDYRAFKSPLDDFRRHIEARGLGDRVTYLARGETYRFRPRPVRRGRTAELAEPHP